MGNAHRAIRGTHHEEEFIDYYSNAGNYGITTPITTLRHTPGTSTGTFETRPSIEHRPIAIPQQSPEEDSFFLLPRVRESDGVPTIDELLDRQRGTTPLLMPITPPARPGTAPLGLEDMPIIPFSPSDAVPNGIMPMDEAINPPSTFPLPTFMETDGPPITLEELRRLDPTIQDVQIISIEDVPPRAFKPQLPLR
jgi:hypothetical protein